MALERSPGTSFLVVSSVGSFLRCYSVPLLSPAEHISTRQEHLLTAPTQAQRFTVSQRPTLGHRLIPEHSVSTGSKRTNWVRPGSQPQNSCSESKRMWFPQRKAQCVSGGELETGQQKQMAITDPLPERDGAGRWGKKTCPSKYVSFSFLQKWHFTSMVFLTYRDRLFTTLGRCL